MLQTNKVTKNNTAPAI